LPISAASKALSFVSPVMLLPEHTKAVEAGALAAAVEAGASGGAGAADAGPANAVVAGAGSDGVL
jgi:hypothetical protein